MQREARLLKEKSLNSLTLSIELFNRPWNLGRTDTVLILLDHSFEMLKAGILQRKGRIREPDISEGHLYVQAQAGVTLHRDLLKAIFGEDLRALLPERVLPIATIAPLDPISLFTEEIQEVARLLRPGKREKQRSAEQVDAAARSLWSSRSSMAYRGDAVDALIKIFGAGVGGPDHDPTAGEYLAAGRHERAARLLPVPADQWRFVTACEEQREDQNHERTAVQ